MPKLLDEIVASRGQEIAVADEFGQTTWLELDERTRRLINALKDASIGPGDTIVMMIGSAAGTYLFFKRKGWL